MKQRIQQKISMTPKAGSLKRSTQLINPQADIKKRKRGLKSIKLEMKSEMLYWTSKKYIGS